MGQAPALISREAAADLLAVVKEKMGDGGDERMNTPSTARNLEAFAKWYRLDDESKLFHALRYNRQLGRDSALLMRRDMGIRSLTALTAVKLPQRSSVDHGKGTTAGTRTTCRRRRSAPRSASGWRWTRSRRMGGMQFRNGSQREGLLTPPMGTWDLLDEYELSDR